MIILISKENLLKIAKINGLRPDQQERHYLQTLILLSLSEYKLILKGGTYLWFCHGLNRFSEDLDFTVVNDIDNNLPEKIQSFLKSFDIESYINDLLNDERTFSFKIGISGPLYNGNPRSRCFIYVEISKREKVMLNGNPFDIYFTYYDLPSKIIRGMDLEEVFCEKIRAIYSRKKARDMYDLYFLIQKGIKPDINLINKKLNYINLEFNKKTLSKRLNEFKDIYNLELKKIVFNKLPDFETVKKVIIESFK